MTSSDVAPTATGDLRSDSHDAVVGSPERPSYAVRAAVVVLTWGCLTGILIGAGELVVHSSTVSSFDRHVTSFVAAHRSPALDSVMKAVTWLGSWVALTLTAVLVLVLSIRRRLPRVFVVLVVVAWAGTQGGTTLAKNAVRRERPPESVRLVMAHGWSWPSGHTATAVLVFTVLASVVWQLTPRVAPRAAAAALALVAALLVGFSRVELGVHWITDVIASLAFASLWLMALLALFRIGGPQPAAGKSVN
jgi:undecaprenyl-diphosphatase